MTSSPSQPNATGLWQRLKERSTLAKVLAAGLLLGLTVWVALPSYFSGQWSWAQPLPIANIQQVRSLRQTALELPRWDNQPQAQLLSGGAVSLTTTLTPSTGLRPPQTALAIAEIQPMRVLPMGGNRWAHQELAHPEANQPPIGVYLLPQMDAINLPAVEWVDVRGTEGWQEQEVQSLTFTATVGDRQAPVTARFFRAAAARTYAVVQWYAWPTGGHASPLAWFWRDQWAQLRRQRQPWVAVYLKIPMRAQSELESMQPLAESLAQDVQAALMADIFTPTS